MGGTVPLYGLDLERIRGSRKEKIAAPSTWHDVRYGLLFPWYL